jgi:hypothetical protein
MKLLIFSVVSDYELALLMNYHATNDKSCVLIHRFIHYLQCY